MKKRYLAPTSKVGMEGEREALASLKNVEAQLKYTNIIFTIFYIALTLFILGGSQGFIF